MLLRFVKFELKPSNLDGMSKCLALILYSWMSQSRVGEIEDK